MPWRDIAGLPEELTFAEPSALVVRRYDRADDGARIHQGDSAQVFDRQPYNKYNDVEPDALDATFRGVGRVVAAVCGHDDFVEYVRRLTFMVLTGNHDAHLKNWSLVYPERLAPRAGVDPSHTLTAVDETVDHFMDAWEEGSDLGLPTAARTAVTQHLAALPLVDPNRPAARRARRRGDAG